MSRVVVLIGLVALLAADGEFLKGQLHLHSSNSRDSATPPAEVVRWYAACGYDFIVFTDHERVTVEPSTPSMLVIPGVELTQNLDQCEPRPPPNLRCLLHVNALFVRPPARGTVPWEPVSGTNRFDLFRRALIVTEKIDGLGQLNHPNFHYSADANLLTRLAKKGLRLFEVANQASDSNNEPTDTKHPSTEKIWDTVLTAEVDIFGTATDDAHHYFDAEREAARGQRVFVGDRGFVMVRAQKNPAAIRSALAKGDFYSSNGVLLSRIARTPTSLEIEVARNSQGVHTFEFIGRQGRVLTRTEGRAATFPLFAASGGYVRAVVIDAQGRRAWVQPIRVEFRGPP